MNPQEKQEEEEFPVPSEILGDNSVRIGKNYILINDKKYYF